MRVSRRSCSAPKGQEQDTRSKVPAEGAAPLEGGHKGVNISRAQFCAGARSVLHPRLRADVPGAAPPLRSGRLRAGSRACGPSAGGPDQVPTGVAAVFGREATREAKRPSRRCPSPQGSKRTGDAARMGCANNIKDSARHGSAPRWCGSATSRRARGISRRARCAQWPGSRRSAHRLRASRCSPWPSRHRRRGA